jgi:uncharacterized coiled-coil DUF342 family protein
MKRNPPVCLWHVLAVFSLSFLASCGSSADKAQTAGLQQKADELKSQADQLAAEAAGIQLKIKDLGSEATNGPEVLAGLMVKEKDVTAEGARLTTLVEDLEKANEKLVKEKEEFIRKYAKP